MAGQSHTPEMLMNRGQELRSVMSKVSGLRMTRPDHAVLTTGKLTAEVEFEPGDWIRVTAAASEGLSPQAALQANSQLEGNVRYAGPITGLLALADTQVDGRSHLPESFQRIGRGLQHAATGKRRRRRRAKSDMAPAAVQAAVDRLGWEEDAIVRLEDQWELRTPFRRAVWPVRFSLEGASLWARRTLLPELPSGCAGEAVSDQALRLNLEIRLARLAQRDGQLVVEVRLHGGQISPSWLEAAAQAVAAGAWRAQATLAALAREPTAARQYVEMFLS